MRCRSTVPLAGLSSVLSEHAGCRRLAVDMAWLDDVRGHLADASNALAVDDPKDRQIEYSLALADVLIDDAIRATMAAQDRAEYLSRRTGDEQHDTPAEQRGER